MVYEPLFDLISLFNEFEKLMTNNLVDEKKYMVREYVASKEGRLSKHMNDHIADWNCRRTDIVDKEKWQEATEWTMQLDG